LETRKKGKGARKKIKIHFHFLTNEFSFRPNDNYAAKPQYFSTLANQGSEMLGISWFLLYHKNV